MRFTTTGQKAVVIAVLVAVSGLLTLLLDALHSEAGSIVLTVLQVLAWYLVSRMFRGPGEPVRAARPWWRMTNRPLLSGVLAAVYGLLALVNIGFSFAGFGSLSGTVSILAELALGGLFAISYLRLASLARAAA
ncbi:hypothetical protein [Leifsonia virtsii]|uniref:Uncharacterized protein n=1 Tax=Leifsonia virtsii TaxID=3035915 RepID=A0ABT8IZC0_9MICO|nr:hypothetical protein [Leifsonia virtsii]MDN4598135.1 hypothetical protein [Leifsonia virtsii]